MRRLPLILITVLLSALGCSTNSPWRPGSFAVVSLLGETYQTASNAPLPSRAEVAYGEHERQCLDFYAAPGEGPRPVYVYFHGGGFALGSKHELRPSVIRAFHACGISVASCNYRLVQDGPLPQPLYAGARAVQFLRYQATEWNIAPERFAAGGHSAGGLIALWLGLHENLADASSPDPVLQQSTRIQCVATSDAPTSLEWGQVKDWFGVSDLRPYPSTKACLGIGRLEQMDDPKTVRLMQSVSPYNYVTADDPPVYLSHTRRVTRVTRFSSPLKWVHHAEFGLRLQAALREQGVEAVVHYRNGPDPGYRDGVDFVAEKLAAVDR